MSNRPATLITGASAGLGVEFARQCAARGDEVVLVARRAARLEKLAAEIGDRAHVIPADLSEAGAADRLVREVAARGLWVRTLINNAGFGLRGRFDELPRDRQLEMIDLNIRALTDLTSAVIGEMASKGGAILNVASTAAFQPGPRMAVYFATKAFVLSFTEALHEEWKDRGIKVSALCPGPTRTEFGEVAGVNIGQFDRLAMNAAPVVKAGLDGLDRNQAVVIPGAINKAGAWSTRFAPRSVVRKIAGSLKF